MLKRLYANNFKCLQNFEFNLYGLNSAFLLGKNGSGKSTIFEVVEIFQKIGKGETLLKKDDATSKGLISESSFPFGNKKLPIEFEIDAEIFNQNFSYKLSIEFPDTFHAPRIKSESLSVDGVSILERDGGQASISDVKHFLLDWHHVGLPLILVRSDKDPLSIFRSWLENIIILSPCPSYFYKLSKVESPTLSKGAENIIDWARWLLSENPSLYAIMSDFLKFRMNDLDIFKFENAGSDDKKLFFYFKEKSNTQRLELHQLSDGEKIFFLAATVIAVQKNNPNLLCLWDEPDNFISLIELDHFIIACRKAFEASDSQAQLIMTSHNAQVINNFSNHNIFVVKRISHLSPTRIDIAEKIEYESKTLVDAFDNGELD